jgi:hypothetical protein
MARQPTLTVNVNSAQFQQFTRNFNAFSGQIRNLNSQFNQINASINKSNVAVRAVQASMNVLLNTTKSLGSEVLKITKHFISWSTIIGGITALLGMGGGLFGIERLAASILAKRRLVLGLGGDYGRTQASQIFSQGLLGSPTNTLQNIQLGLKGAPDQMKALLSMGIPFGTKMQPDEVMDKYMEKLAGILSRARPGTELMVAHAYGADKILGMDEIIRLTTEEGRKELQLKRELVKQYAPLMQITPRAQRAWAELEMQFQAAKAQIESVFGEKLADLAKPLKDLSDGFAQLVRVLMRSPIVQQLIKDLGDWIEKLATKMKGLTEKDINDFVEMVRSWLPTMEDLKSNFSEFVEILKGAVEALKWLKSWIPGSVDMGAAATALGAPKIHDFGSSVATPYLKDLWHHPGKLFKGGPLDPHPNAPLAPGGATAGSQGSVAPGGGAFGGGAAPFNSFGMGGGGAFGQLASPGTGWMDTPGGSLGGGGRASWPDAAGNRVPSISERFGNWLTTPLVGGGGASRPAPGPLSMDNWQMNRTASLVVRNVPGANVFMTAAGMTG